MVLMVRPEFKDRYVAFYLPRASDLPRWKTIAKEAGISLSSFICEAVEAFIGGASRQAIEVESKELLDENARFREELNNKKLTISKLENTIVGLEAEIDRMLFTIQELNSNRINLSTVFIKILTKKINEKDIQEALRNDETAYEQLMSLEKAGIIVETKDGWKMVNTLEEAGIVVDGKGRR